MADESPEQRPGKQEEPGQDLNGRLRDRQERDANDRAAAAARIAQQETWVDLQLRRAVERGDFENLPGYGKPLADLTGEHDPDWWVKRLIEREQITGVVPPSLQMRREDAALDGALDRLATEKEVRREVEEFNARVRWALYRPPEGPPMVTPQRDIDTEVERWAERRLRRLEELRAARAEADAADAADAEAARGRKVRRRRWRRPSRPGP